MVMYVNENEDIEAWTFDVCFQNIQKDQDGLKYIPKKFNLEEYNKLCLEAIHKIPYQFRYINPKRLDKEKYTNLCILTSLKYPFVLMSAKTEDILKDKYFDICMNCIKYVPNIHDTSDTYKDYIPLNCIKVEMLTHEQYTTLCDIAVQHHPESLKYVDFSSFTKEKSLEICKKSTAANPSSIEFVPTEFQDEDMCNYCINKIPDSIRFCRYRTKDMCMYAFDENVYNLEYIPEEFQTKEMCEILIKISPVSIYMVKNQTYELCKLALSLNPVALDNIRDKTEEFCEFAVKNYGLSIAYVEHQTEKLCMMAVKQFWRAILYIKNPTLQMYVEALKQHPNAIKYIDEKIVNKTEIIKKVLSFKLDTPSEKLKESLKDLQDPVTSDGLVKGEIYGFFINKANTPKETWHLAGSLEDFSNFIIKGYKDSSITSVFVPVLNSLYPICDIRWIRF